MLLLCLALLLAPTDRPTLPNHTTITASVVGILDGDTLDVLFNRQTYRLRLANIDAPEKDQPYGAAAKRALSALAYRKTLQIESHGSDRYGRTIATVSLSDQTQLNQVLVATGYAWCFIRHNTDPALPDLELRARQSQSGLWADPHPIPPWEWRQRPLPALHLTR